MSEDSRVGADIRSAVGHPIIDCDGHTLEHFPTFLEYVREIAGEETLRLYTQVPAWYEASEQERVDKRLVRPPWWVIPSGNTTDVATAMFPALLEERLEQFGIDFTVLFPTFGAGPEDLPGPEMQEIRRGSCRAYNAYQAERYRPHAAHMTPAARIPVHTPDEAIEEIRYASEVLGLKVMMMTGHARRPVSDPTASSAGDFGSWVDNLTLDSLYDYDPVWALCREQKLLPCFHGASAGWGSKVSISNYMFNHIGKFATANEAICKGLFMGGVTRRFPDLKFGFLEGGVGWAVNLVNDLISHWDKRSDARIREYDPANIDWAAFGELAERYQVKNGGRGLAAPTSGLSVLPPRLQVPRDAMGPLDDFGHTDIGSVSEFAARFTENFYFGCEADDRMNGLAFDRTLTGLDSDVKAVFSSDIGHWDVPDMAKVVVEAYELVEDGLLDAEGFRKFTFDYPAELLRSCGDELFVGTVLERSAG
ncbi:MAG: amidohydrolase [Actinomycetia bacterium]|nr:amidohydrolase [Actinomycetes bacterium]